MLAVSKYDQAHIDAVRERIAADVAAFESAAPGDGLQPVFFNALVLALDRYFVHRLRGAEGKDGNPANEVRVLCVSLVENGGVMLADKQIKLTPDGSVLGIAPGERIAVDAAGFTRLAEGFFAEIEKRYT